jgi:hypothetical protein
MKEALRKIIDIFDETSDYEVAKEKAKDYFEARFDKIREDTFRFIEEYENILSEKTREFSAQGYDPVTSKDRIVSEAACALLGHELCKKAAEIEIKHPDFLQFMLKTVSDLDFKKLLEG